MLGAVERGAQRGDVRGDAGGGLVVDDEQGFELVSRVRAEPPLELVRGRSVAVGDLDALALDAVRLGRPREARRGRPRRAPRTWGRGGR